MHVVVVVYTIFFMLIHNTCVRNHWMNVKHAAGGIFFVACSILWELYTYTEKCHWILIQTTKYYACSPTKVVNLLLSFYRYVIYNSKDWRKRSIINAFYGVLHFLLRAGIFLSYSLYRIPFNEMFLNIPLNRKQGMM